MYLYPPDHQKAVLLEWCSTSWFYIQGPVEDQPGHLAKVRLPRPGLPERLLGKGPAGGAVQRGKHHLLLGGQEGASVLPNQRLQPDAVLQWRARIGASVGSHRYLRPHEGGPNAR